MLYWRSSNAAGLFRLEDVPAADTFSVDDVMTVGLELS